MTGNELANLILALPEEQQAMQIAFQTVQFNTVGVAVGNVEVAGADFGLQLLIS